jgi:metal-responsive CopG/Arc/MetJ family transcriptional regulator
MQGLLGKRGVDWMKPRTKQPTRPIHVTLPIKMLEDFDATLRYNQSRSKKIALLINDYMNGDGALVRETNTRQLLRAICNRSDTDETLRTLLLQILSQSS